MERGLIDLTHEIVFEGHRQCIDSHIRDDLSERDDREGVTDSLDI